MEFSVNAVKAIVGVPNLLHVKRANHKIFYMCDYFYYTCIICPPLVQIIRSTQYNLGLHFVAGTHHCCEYWWMWCDIQFKNLVARATVRTWWLHSTV
jgi:hypothetical protein